MRGRRSALERVKAERKQASSASISGKQEDAHTCDHATDTGRQESKKEGSKHPNCHARETREEEARLLLNDEWHDRQTNRDRHAMGRE